MSKVIMLHESRYKSAVNCSNTLSKFVETLVNSSPKNLVVIGDLMLDEYLIGSVDRISPEAPVPVFREKSLEKSKNV